MSLEREIIERFKRGEKSAFCDLVEIHRERIYAVACSWLHNSADALDITQEAFLKLYFFLPRWRKRAQLSTWLYRTTVNLCIDLARKKARERKGIEKLINEAEVPIVDKSLTDGCEAAALVRQEVDRLPPRQKAVIVLRHYRSLSLKEVARILECPLGTVKANLYFAIRSLRARLLRRDALGLVSSGAARRP